MARITTDGTITDKMESFCQEYCIDDDATKAYIRAGYAKKTARVNSSLLIAKYNIKRRIASIKAELARKHGITQETIATEAEEHRVLALLDGNITGANGALVIKAKAYGLQTDKSVVETTEQAKELKEAEVAAAKDYARFKLRRQA